MFPAKLAIAGSHNQSLPEPLPCRCQNISVFRGASTSCSFKRNAHSLSSRRAAPSGTSQPLSPVDPCITAARLLKEPYPNQCRQLGTLNARQHVCPHCRKQSTPADIAGLHKHWVTFQAYGHRRQVKEQPDSKVKGSSSSGTKRVRALKKPQRLGTAE